MEKTDYTRLAAKLICLSFAVLAFYLIFKYALGIILPFAVAFCIGVPINKLAGRAHKRLRLPRRFCAGVFVILAFCAVSALVYFGLNRLLLEVGDLIEWSEGDGGGIGDAVGRIVGYVEDLSSKIPFLEQIEKIEGLEGFRQSIDNGVQGLLTSVIESITSSIPRFVMDVVKKTPKFFITLVVAILACFYFATDYDRIKEGVVSVLPKSFGMRISRSTSALGGAVKNYAKAYLLIMLITFLEVFVGLIIIGKRYALILAAAVAVVDVLPVLGAGSVLVPWALVSFAIGDHHSGIGLLILYGVITIIRQIIEPKIVGGTLGIHPLATLFSMFAGLSLFGFAGMILGPCVFLVSRELIKDGEGLK